MSEVAKKWGVEVAKRGFSQIPNYLLHINQFAEPEDRLSPIELLILIELSAAWWKVEDHPYPSMRTLAVRCGTSERQVLRAISKLEKLPLLKRIKRRMKGIITSNAYDLSPLVDQLREVARLYPAENARKVVLDDTKDGGK